MHKLFYILVGSWAAESKHPRPARLKGNETFKFSNRKVDGKIEGIRIKHYPELERK
jgi:hypothetical protein